MGIVSAFGEVAEMMSLMFNKLRDGSNKLLSPIIRDGTVPAFFRQGADEIGVALKAFPESIQVHEPGTILNPTQGEIAASRKPNGGVYGQGKSNPPSPSEVAKNKRPYVPDQNQERGRGREMGRE